MRNQRNPRESGVVMVLFLFSLPVLLSFVALAIDAGRLYAARQNLNKATRVAALVSLNFMSLRGWGALVTDNRDSLGYQTGPIVQAGAANLNPPEQPTSTGNILLQEMTRAVADTMQSYYPGSVSNQHLQFLGADGWETSVPTSALHLGDSSVRLTIRYGVPTLLYGRFMQLVNSNWCSRGSNGEVRCWVENSPSDPAGLLKPLNMFLLLDTSGSMSGATGTGSTKIAVLKEAVANFIDMFNPFKDKIAVIDYGTAVKSQGQLTTFDSASGQHLNIKNNIQALQAGGLTNPCDALVQSIAAAAGAELSPNDATAVVLFSDGSPNVSRLKYCDFDEDDSCNTPERVQDALDEASLPVTAADQGWYSWITKWGRRQLVSCPNGPGTDGVRNCDPVYGWPALVDKDGRQFSLADIRANLRLHEDGYFIWKTGPNPADELPITTEHPTLQNGPYYLQFDTLSRVEDNYKWNGPSYLVHASTPPESGRSLLDRIPAAFTPAPVTCGPGSRPNYPGAWDPITSTRREMYTHSRYFGSRILNRNWVLGPANGVPSQHRNQREKVGLDAIEPNGNQPIDPPEYFTERHPQRLMNNQNQSPGCLETLNTQIPFTANSGNPNIEDAAANIFVGGANAASHSFLSNDPNDLVNSITAVGEIVKSAELPYYCALRAADYLRSQYGAIVFVVGLGPRAADIYGEQCEDPLQNPLDFDSRKDNFLRRLAFAPESLVRQEVDEFIEGGEANWHSSNDFGYRYSPRDLSTCNSSNHPLYNQTVVTLGYGEELSGTNPVSRSPNQHNFTPRHFGAYYGCNDPSQLNEVFGNIAKQILLRLAT